MGFLISITRNTGVHSFWWLTPMAGRNPLLWKPILENRTSNFTKGKLSWNAIDIFLFLSFSLSVSFELNNLFVFHWPLYWYYLTVLLKQPIELDKCFNAFNPLLRSHDDIVDYYRGKIQFPCQHLKLRRNSGRCFNGYIANWKYSPFSFSSHEKWMTERILCC